MYGNDCKVIEKISDKRFKVKMLDGTIMNGQISSNKNFQLEIGDICFLAAVRVEEDWLIAFKGFSILVSTEDQIKLRDL